MGRAKKPTQIINPELKKVIEDNESFRLAHLAKLDAMSNDIRMLEEILSRSAILESRFELNNEEYLIWNGKRIFYISNDVGRPLIETPLHIRLKHADRLSEFAQFCFNQIQKDK